VVHDLDLVAHALGRAAEAWDLVQLPQAGEAAPLFPITDNLMTVTFKSRHFVQLRCRGRFEKLVLLGVKAPI
jgi:hypothetical protein